MKTYNETNGDLTLKEALFLAQSKLESSKLQDKRVRLKKAEDRLDSFIEIYLYFAWIIWLAITVAAIVLSLIFPPRFFLNVLDKCNNNIWAYIIYSLLIAVLCSGFAIGLYFLVDKFGEKYIVLRGKKLDEELIAWANKRTEFNFKRIHQKFRGSYGAWKWSKIQANDEFYIEASKAMSTLLSKGADTAEEAYEFANQEIMRTIKNNNTVSLIIACYLATSFQSKGIDNTRSFISR